MRQDVIVIEQQAIPETLALTETMPAGLAWNWACTASAQYNSIFSAFSFGTGYYPTNGNMDIPAGKPVQAKYPTDDAGEIFAGSILGDAYPV